MKVLSVALMISLAFAAEEEKPLPADFVASQDKISDKYFAGAYLIYDCEENHFVCVLPEDNKVCEVKRAEAIKNKEKFLPCASLGEFPTKKSCFQRELYMVGKAHGNRFCILDELKKEELE